MVNYLIGEKKANKEAILQAINSLKERGCDVNPYSVASETGLPRQLIAREPELMRLLADARSIRANAAPVAAQPGDMMEAQSDDRLQELEAYNSTLRQRIKQVQAELVQLRQETQNPHPLDASLHEELNNLQSENGSLREQINKLKEEVQSASKCVNIAWQQGYLAGQHAAVTEMQEQKTFVDTLADAAHAATVYGGVEGITTSAADVTTNATATEFPAETAAYITEALQIDDPEVLNDPFTARLLDALGVELEPVQSAEQALTAEDIAANPASIDPIHGQFEEGAEGIDVATSEEAQLEPAAIAAHQFSYEPDGIIDQSETAVIKLNDHASVEAPSISTPEAQPINAPEALPAQPAVQQASSLEGDLMGHPCTAGVHIPYEGEGEDDEMRAFTADELHNLFRNKYVRGDDGEIKDRDPSMSGTFPSFKKFVGTNKTSSVEPIPAMTRAFPPQIRKACRLLGLNPEELTRPIVTEAWKKEMAKPGVHPDTGGDTEMAIYLNTAKDTLMRWVDDQAPKLGKKFGSSPTREHQKPTQPKQE